MMRFAVLLLAFGVLSADAKLNLTNAKQNMTVAKLAPGLALPKDPCAKQVCEPLECPGGFTASPSPGHCCPYCVNPSLKFEAAVNGASGKHGGFTSTFCKGVWCFPTMCTQGTKMPNGMNGQCCPECSGGSGRR